MTSRQLRVFELLLVIAIAFLPSFIKSVTYIFTSANFDYSRINYSDYLIGIIESILSIMLLFYVLFKNERSYSFIGLKLRLEWKDILISLGLIFAFGIVYSILIVVIRFISPDFASISQKPQNIGFLETKYYGFLSLMMILSPFQEELIVRGFTMTEIFELTNNRIISIIVSVGIQFSYHLYQGILPALLMLPYFIIISIYFLKTRNLNPVIYSHILIDLIVLIRLL